MNVLFDKVNLFTILFLLVPGVVSLKTYHLLVPSGKKDLSKSLYEILVYSVINCTVFLLLILEIYKESFYKSHPFLFWLYTVIIVLMAPILWPILLRLVMSWNVFSKRIIHPVPLPWDYVFGKKSKFWIIVHLKNGTHIGGKYYENSFASSYPDKEQIYLEEIYRLDEHHVFSNEPITRSAGMLIMGDEITAIEFFK